MRGRTLIVLETLTAAFVGVGGLAARGATPQSPAGDKAPKREAIEWCDIWVSHADKDDLPRILFIGDSITGAYFKDVESRLAGKAYCARVTTSKCIGDPALLPEVELLLNQYRFQVIHVNNGMHGWAYSEEQYSKAFKFFLQPLLSRAPGASLIWAHTTPVMVSGSPTNERTERVKARNKIAAAFATENHIIVNDLFNLMIKHPEWYSPDGVHFNKAGIDAEAEQVADYILKVLRDPSRKKDETTARVVHFNVLLENGAKGPIKITTNDNRFVHEAETGRVDLDVSSLPDGKYTMFISSPGYAAQWIKIVLPNAIESASALQVGLFKERYVVMRYAFNSKGGRNLTGRDVQAGRVAVSHWGHMEFFGEDWQVWQSGDNREIFGKTPYIRFFRITTGFGFITAPLGKSFDSVKEAPDSGYQCEDIKAVKGTVLICRVNGNETKGKGYGKLVIEGITEKPPSGVRVIRSEPH